MFFKRNIIILLLFIFSIGFISGENKPFPQHTPYTNGVIKPNSHTQEELDRYASNFYSFWKKHYLFEVKGSKPLQKFVFYTCEAWDPNGFKVEGVKDSYMITSSEATGYGMLILAYMAGFDAKAKEDFDALYYFYKAHGTSNDSALMSDTQYAVYKGLEYKFSKYDAENATEKQVKDKVKFLRGLVTKTVSDLKKYQDKIYSATEGDMEIAYALLLADNQWGSGGAINYRAEALKVIQAMMKLDVDQEEWILKLGSFVTKENSSLDQRLLKATKPSLFLFDQIQLFAQVDKENSEKWMKVYNKCVDISTAIFKSKSLKSGLMPDYCEKIGKDWVPAVETLAEGATDGDYNYNSCKTPWRFASSFILTGDRALLPQLTVLNDWIQKETGGAIRGSGEDKFINAGYYVGNGESGKRLPDTGWDDLSFASPFAVSAMIDVKYQNWLNKLFDAVAVNDETNETNPGFANFTNLQGDYYGHTIAMQVILIATGNYWLPK